MADHPDAGIIAAFKITPRRGTPIFLERYVGSEILDLTPGAEAAALSRLVVHPGYGTSGGHSRSGSRRTAS